MNGNNYEVIKEVRSQGSSDVEGQYFVGGELSKDHALTIAENLSVIDRQINTEIVSNLIVKYKVINADTHKVVQVFEI